MWPITWYHKHCLVAAPHFYLCANVLIYIYSASFPPPKGPWRLTALAPKASRARVCSQTRLQKQINKNEMAVFDPKQPLASFFGNTLSAAEQAISL